MSKEKFGIGPKMVYWVLLGQNLNKPLLYIKINTFKSVKMERFTLKFGTGNALFGYF